MPWDPTLMAVAARGNEYTPHAPTPKQLLFLAQPTREAFYGGQAGGGKSDALLMAALMFVDVPGYNAILFRRTYADLALPGALMDRAHQWLSSTDAAWSGERKMWRFPSGATLSFGYLDTTRHKYRYQGSEFQFCGFDELTQFEEADYLYLFSRLRRLAGSDVPMRLRAASNPGGDGHEWVKGRFVSVPSETRPFIPAGLEDNPHLDREDYEASLANLDDVTRAQLLAGDWDAALSGPVFRSDWFRRRWDRLPESIVQVWTAWDTAYTERTVNDESAAVTLARDKSGLLYVLNVQHGHWDGPTLRDRMAALATRLRDTWGDRYAGAHVEAKASGLTLLQFLREECPRHVFVPIQIMPGEDKVSRALRITGFCESERVLFPEQPLPWVQDTINRLVQFPEVAHLRDVPDAFVHAVTVGVRMWEAAPEPYSGGDAWTPPRL